MKLFKFSFITLFLLATFLACKSFDEEKDIKVLFIGNSLTYYNQMPELLQSMLDETDPNIKTEVITFPGMSLNRHLGSVFNINDEEILDKYISSLLTPTEQKILESEWDVVVLQTGTVQLLIPEAKEYLVNSAIQKTIKLINNPSTKILLFNTWPSLDSYPKKYCYPGMIINRMLEHNENYCSPTIQNLEEELELINSAYQNIADRNGIIKTNHGDFYYLISQQYPKIKLLEDEIHPSREGAFLNASIFYQILTGKKANKLKYNGKIDKETANILKNIILKDL
jgi:hypothetical protein